MNAPETVQLDIAPLLRDSLRAGNPVRFRSEGTSMEPFVQPGDIVTVAPLETRQIPSELRSGDVLLYERAPGVLRLHRLSRVRHGADAAPWLRVRGDAVGQPAELIPAHCVLGVLVLLERDGRTHDARHPLRRLTGLWWPRLRSRLGLCRPASVPAIGAPPDRSVDGATYDTLLAALRATLRQSSPPPSAIAATAVPTGPLVALAQRHGVLALCAEALHRRCPPAKEALRAATRALVLEGEDDRVAIAAALDVLTNAGLRPLVVKGPALGALVFDTPAARPYDDLDLLMSNPDRALAMPLLQRAGWRDSRGSPPLAQRHLLRTTEDLAFRHPAHHVGIELVHPGGILRNALRQRSSASAFVPFSVHASMATTLEPVEHFLYCVAHGGKHGWTRLIWLADLDRLSAKFGDAEWGRVLTLTHDRGLTRLLALACAMAHELLGMPFPRDALGRWRDSRWLERTVARCVSTHHEGARHVETWRWWVGLQDTPRQRIHELVRWLFHPTGADFRARLLPLWAHPLYALLRPLRLLRRMMFRHAAPELSWREPAPEAR